MRKPNKPWVDKGSEFCNDSFKKWLTDNDIEMYSTHDEEKSVVAERFMRTFKNKIYNHKTVVSKNAYIDKLDNIVNEYNNTHHRTIKVKTTEVKDNTYIDSIKKANDKDCKFKVGDHAITPKYKNVFAKRYTPNWSEEAFVITKVKNAVPWTYVITNLVKILLDHFMKNNYKKQINKDLG